MTRFIGILWGQGQEGHTTFVLLGMSGADRQNRGLKNLFFFFFFLAKVRSKEVKGFNILRAYELKFGPNLGCTTENPFEILGKLLLQESKFIIMCPKFGSKELNHAVTRFRLGSWGSKERRERREKGVLTAGHTRITFSSECPRDGDGEQLKCSEYILSCQILQLITYASQLTLVMK